MHSEKYYFVLNCFSIESIKHKQQEIGTVAKIKNEFYQIPKYSILVYISQSVLYITKLPKTTVDFKRLSFVCPSFKSEQKYLSHLIPLK